MFTEEVGYSKGYHSPDRLEVNGSKCKGSREYLADAQASDPRPYSKFRDEFVAHDASHDHSDAAYDDSNREQPPAQVVVGEVLSVVKIAVVGETHAAWKEKNKINISIFQILNLR